MENEKCTFEGCSENMGFYCGPELNLKLCWTHMQELNKSGLSYQGKAKILNFFYRPLFNKNHSRLPKFQLVNAFGNNCLCWGISEQTELTGEIITVLNRIQDLFIQKFLKIDSAKESKIFKLCETLAGSLNEVIYNLVVDVNTFYPQISQIFINFITQKQDLIVKLFNDELEKLALKLNMPKTATKNLFNTVHLDAFVNDFIRDLIKQGNIDFDDCFQKFLNHFSPFFSTKPDSDVFDALEKNFVFELDKIEHQIKNELESLVTSIWEKNKYVRFSVILKEIRDEALEWDIDFTVLTSLFLVEAEVEIKSVTQISVYDLILIFEINSNSFVVQFSDKKAYLMDVFKNISVLCADGSNESILALNFNPSKKCILFCMEDFRIYPLLELNLKLEANETLVDFIYIQGTRSQIVYTTSNNILSSIHETGPRCLINIEHDQESECKLKYFKSKQLILLSSNSKLRVFTEKLEKIGEYLIVFDNFSYYLTNSRILRILGIKSNYLEEYWLDSKLDYPERHYKNLPLPKNATQFVTRSYEGVKVDELTQEFLKFFNRTFSIS